MNRHMIALSVSDSPDLDRLGLFDRSMRLTVSALATALVRHGCRVAYGGNLDRSGFTYTLYPAIAEAYRSLAATGRPPFVHYIACYQWEDRDAVIKHVQAVKHFAEICLVNGEGNVISISMRNREFVLEYPSQPPQFVKPDDLNRALRDIPSSDGEQATDLFMMRSVMEANSDARIILGGKIAGYSGSMPGIFEEALNALRYSHLLVPLGGFGGAARDVAIVLGVLHERGWRQGAQLGRGYEEARQDIVRYAPSYQRFMKGRGAWENLVASAQADDPESVARHVMRVLARYELASP